MSNILPDKFPSVQCCFARQFAQELELGLLVQGGGGGAGDLDVAILRGIVLHPVGVALLELVTPFPLYTIFSVFY